MTTEVKIINKVYQIVVNDGRPVSISVLDSTTIYKNGTRIGNFRSVNLIEGDNITIDISNENNRANITISGQAGGDSGLFWKVSGATTVTTPTITGDVTFDGNIEVTEEATINNLRIIPGSISSTPIVDQPFFQSSLGYFIYRPNASGALRAYWIPNGSITAGALATKAEWFTTDYSSGSTNYAAFNLLCYTDEIHLGSNKGGTGSWHVQYYGGKYIGSSLQSSSAWLRFNVNNTVTANGTWTFNTAPTLSLTNATGLPPTTGISGWPSDASGALTNNGSGTYSYVSYQPLDSDLTSWAAVTRASGFDTWVATPSWTNFSSLITGTAPYWPTTGSFSITSPIATGNFQLNGRLLVNTATGSDANAYFDMSANTFSLGADGNLTTRTNSTAKSSHIVSAHYTNSQPFGYVIGMANGVTTNIVRVGGGDASYNSATAIEFYTASGSTTVTGTKKFDIGGDGIVKVGSFAAQTLGGIIPRFQVTNTTVAASSTSQFYSSNDASGSRTIYAKSRNNTPGSSTILQDNDVIQSTDYVGDNGVNRSAIAASTFVRIDGTPSSTSMPGEYVIATTAAGAVTPTERVVISPTGKVTFNNDVAFLGTENHLVTSVTSSLTAGTHHLIRCNATSAAITVTLPAVASTDVGREYVIKKTDSSINTVTIDGNSSETIDGATTQVLSLQYQYLRIVNNGSSWDITGQ